MFMVLCLVLSGMQTAKHLIEKYGLKSSRLMVLEAQNYVGGRVLQTDSFVKGFKIDLGILDIIILVWKFIYLIPSRC